MPLYLFSAMFQVMGAVADVFSSLRDETLYPAAGIHALNPGEGGTISFFPAMPQRHGYAN